MPVVFMYGVWKLMAATGGGTAEGADKARGTADVCSHYYCHWTAVTFGR